MSKRFAVKLDADHFDRLAPTVPQAGVAELVWSILYAKPSASWRPSLARKFDVVEYVVVSDTAAA